MALYWGRPKRQRFESERERFIGGRKSGSVAAHRGDAETSARVLVEQNNTFTQSACHPRMIEVAIRALGDNAGDSPCVINHKR